MSTAIRALPQALVLQLQPGIVSANSCRIPSSAVLRQPLTKDTVHRYPYYFMGGLAPGRGYQRARQTLCRHQYYLTDSCPDC